MFTKTATLRSRIARHRLTSVPVEVILFGALALDAITTAAGLYHFGTAIEANVLLPGLWEWSLAHVEIVQQPVGMDQMPIVREEWLVAAGIFAILKTLAGAVIAAGVWAVRRAGAPYADYWATGLTVAVLLVVIRNLGVWL